MLEAIGVGIAISIITSSAESLAKKINIFHCSKKVINEIEAAYDDVIKEWTKNHGARDKAFIVDKEILRDFFNGELKSEDFSNLPKEKKEFIELFKYALAKRENAHRYLTFNVYENRFNELIRIQGQQSANQNALEAGQLQMLGKLDEIIEKLNEKVEIKYDKHDVNEDQEFFIGNLADYERLVASFIKRHIQSANSNEEISFDFFEGSNSLDNFKDVFNAENNKSQIVLIGNPGSGKSGELRRLALTLWNDKDNDLIPLYRDLRNFTERDTISSFFDLDKVDEYLNVVFILDGLDEIKDEQDFLSKFNSYFNNRRNKSHRYVLSCRSNIFENYKNELDKFETYELQKLSMPQAQKMLYNLTNEKFGINQLYEFSLKSSFIDDPFKLQLLANYYRNFGKLETNQTVLWNKYLETILEHDKLDKFSKKKHNYYELRSDIQCVALLLEMTKSLEISEENIYKLLERNRERTESFIHCAIVLNNQNEYLFENKQLQEYLSASLISFLDFDRIKELFTIDSLPAIKPSLENSLTMLLDLLGDDINKQKELRQWISEIKQDLLFKADLDRVKSFQIPVFQEYFKKQCVETTLWVGNTTSVSVKEIARFADCHNNQEFLLAYFLDENEHFRVRISALNILEHFKPKNTDELKERFIGILKNPDTKLNLKGYLINLIRKWNFVKEHPNIIHEIIEIFKEEDHSEISTRILSIIKTDEYNIDDYFDFIKKEFDFIFGKQKRRNDDRVIRGNRLKVEDLMLKLKENSNFLELLTEYLHNNKSRNHYSDNEEKIIERLKEMKKDDSEIFLKLAKSVVTQNDFNFHFRDYLIVRVVQMFDECLRLIKWLFEEQDFSRSKWLMARIVNKECINYYINNWLQVLGENNPHLEGFRNIVSSYHKQEDWHFKIEKSYEKSNVRIKNPLKSITPMEELNREYKKKVEQDLKLLFNRDGLIKEVDALFKQLDKDKVTQKELYHEFLIKNNRDDDFFILFGYHGVGYDLINSLLIQEDNKEVSIEECEHYIDEPKFFVFFIERQVKDAMIHDNIDINASIIKQNMELFVIDLITKINVTDILEYSSSSKFSIKNQDKDNYQSFQIIQAIHELILIDSLSISVPEDFLLKTLEYFDIRSFDNNENKFEKYLNKIQDKENLDNKILENLSRPIFSSVYIKHAFYALENDLKESFEFIKEYLLRSDDIRSELPLLDKYIEKNGPEILLEMMTDIYSIACWKAIEISMKKEVHEDECILKAKKYLDSNRIKYKTNAANVLLRTNQPEIINYIAKDLENRIHFLHPDQRISIKNYTQLPDEGFNFIERSFDAIFKKDKDDTDDKYKRSALVDFFRNYIINIALKDGNYEKVQKVLKKIKASLRTNEKESSDELDERYFFINLFIDECEKSYINKMSKPLSFKKAFKLVNDLKI